MFRCGWGRFQAFRNIHHVFKRRLVLRPRPRWRMRNAATDMSWKAYLWPAVGQKPVISLAAEILQLSAKAWN